MTAPNPTPPARKDPPPAALLGLGAVFLSLGVVFLTTLDNFAGAVASTGFMAAGGIFVGLGLIRLLKARR